MTDFWQQEAERLTQRVMELEAERDALKQKKREYCPRCGTLLVLSGPVFVCVNCVNAKAITEGKELSQWLGPDILGLNPASSWVKTCDCTTRELLMSADKLQCGQCGKEFPVAE